jgi:hypothetical protein
VVVESAGVGSDLPVSSWWIRGASFWMFDRQRDGHNHQTLRRGKKDGGIITGTKLRQIAHAPMVTFGEPRPQLCASLDEGCGGGESDPTEAHFPSRFYQGKSKRRSLLPLYVLGTRRWSECLKIVGAAWYGGQFVGGVGTGRRGRWLMGPTRAVRPPHIGDFVVVRGPAPARRDTESVIT